MIDVSHVPPELMQQVRSMFVALFGGKEKLDYWLTEIADELANPDDPSVRPLKLDSALVPMDIQALMYKPKEVVDMLIESTDNLGVFEYRTEVKKVTGGFLAITFDQLTGHIIEEMEGPDQDILVRSMIKKYGHNYEVVKE
ncbi:MAG: hypothetical protein KJ822_08625 [Proteobacteria bacterium]|nr:hypothetical protein [Pseudomonadota bacterium]